LKRITIAIALIIPHSAIADLRDEVERLCEVYYYDAEYGEVECWGLREVERDCEAYRYDVSGGYGELECRDFDELDGCDVIGTDDYGEIDC